MTNWAHPETLNRLSSIGVVDANPDRSAWPHSEITRRAAESGAILAFMPDRIDAAFLSQCRKLRVVACALKGFDNFDVFACTAAGACSKWKIGRCQTGRCRSIRS